MVTVNQSLRNWCTDMIPEDFMSSNLIYPSSRRPWVQVPLPRQKKRGFLFNEIMDKALNEDSKFPLTVWLCNVTHTVFGEHPEVIYITRIL